MIERFFLSRGYLSQMRDWFMDKAAERSGTLSVVRNSEAIY
jgi:hypothetical protein